MGSTIAQEVDCSPGGAGQEIKAGNTERERTCRRHLRGLSADLRVFKWSQAVGRAITILSVPGFVADALFAGGFIGLTGMLVGIGVKAMNAGKREQIRLQILGMGK